MAALATAINLNGILFLSHAVYSSYEHSLLLTTTATNTHTTPSSLLSSLDPKTSLPTDIILELLLSTLLLCIGVVMSSRDLKPIQWNVWAGKLERDSRAREWKGVGQGGGNPYAAVEERRGFWDVRGAREEYAKWMRQDGGKAT